MTTFTVQQANSISWTADIINKHLLNVLIQVNKLVVLLNRRTANILNLNVNVGLMPISHRRHGQDKTVLSCLVRVGGVNWIGDKTRQFCLVSTQFSIWNCSVSNILRTTENCLDLCPNQFTPPTRTRQDSLVLSVSLVWTIGITNIREDHRRNCIAHTATALHHSHTVGSKTDITVPDRTVPFWSSLVL